MSDKSSEKAYGLATDRLQPGYGTSTERAMPERRMSRAGAMNEHGKYTAGAEKVIWTAKYTLDSMILKNIFG